MMHLSCLHCQHVLIVVLMKLQSGFNVALLGFVTVFVWTWQNTQTWRNARMLRESFGLYSQFKLLTWKYTYEIWPADYLSAFLTATIVLKWKVVFYLITLPPFPQCVHCMLWTKSSSSDCKWGLWTFVCYLHSIWHSEWKWRKPSLQKEMRSDYVPYLYLPPDISFWPGLHPAQTACK